MTLKIDFDTTELRNVARGRYLLGVEGSNVRFRNGFVELFNEDTELWHQLRCRNDDNDAPELYVSENGTG